MNGFSKLYAMTGCGWGTSSPRRFIVRPMQKVQQNFFISANALIQMAGIAALKGRADVERMRGIYDQRRRFMIHRLKELGFGITVEPTGAFYIFVNASHLSPDSYALAFDILAKARVGVTPGIDFGRTAEGYLRFSYANSLENIAEGMDRLEAYFRNPCCGAR